MKKVFLLFLFFTQFIYTQNIDKACATITKINQILQARHYKPKPLDDSLSVFVFKNLLEKLDSENNLFSKLNK